jgi:hypothetical protein
VAEEDSSKRPPPGDDVTYRLRIDLTGTEPPLWRQLDVASDLFLDELHWIIQVAFGWENCHLHQFTTGRGRNTKYFLCSYLADDDEGIPEEEVRLDEVLVRRGDKLSYEYDFGDCWQHTIKLEARLARADTEPIARCVAGDRDGPPEECGGVYDFEELCASGDPDLEVTKFDIGEINKTLASLTEEPDDGQS